MAPTTALLVVDVVTGIFALPEPLHEPESFLSNVTRLVTSARHAGVLVVHVQHTGPEGSVFARGSPAREFHPSVAPRPGEPLVDKDTPDSFLRSNLESVLREAGIRELCVCGFATEGCIDTTVRSAWSRGFSVVLASDCHTTTRNAVLEASQVVAHHNLVLRRFARVVPLAEVAFSAPAH
ncbi:MAG: cysteine hydrolase [Deltaproteobacteria bacterium]|nr:cysteine hydrolase [Deltaproteobacteria bacterium]